MGKREITLPMKMLSSKVLNLGYVDENLHTRVIIDCSEVLWDYPGATVDMVVRPPSGNLYPVTPDRDNNNNIIWDITANDLVYAGTGQLQLTFTDSGEIIKSIVGTTKVLPSLETTGEAPEPLQNWMDAAEQTAEQIAETAATGVVGELIDDTAGAGVTTKTWSASKVSGAVGAKVDEPSSEGTDGQVLATDGSGGRYWRTVSGGGGGGGGTTDYSELTNKPQINSITLTGNKSLSDLGIAAASSVPDVSGKADKVSSATNGHFAGLDGNGNLTDSGKSASDFGTYSKPSGGIPSTDMTSAVQTSLGKANSAYQKPGNGIPSTDLTQAVQTSLGKADTAYQKPVSGIPDADLANSYIKEPTSDGTSGQVLTTNGSGGRSWTTVQGGGSVTLTYVTPEDYGAAGDGTTDDTTAIQNCINYARSNNKAVRGYNQYKTTGPIAISGSYQDIEIDGITYTGNDYGVSITGSYNNVKINKLYCSNGRGLVMTRSANTSCSWNKIYIMRLFAKGHSVDFDTNDNFIIYNTFDIRAAKSDTGNCFNGNEYVRENVFNNTSCDCANGWAIYKIGGRFYNFTMEGAVLNGIYMPDIGSGYYAGFRYREMVDKIVFRINGTDPNTQGGTLIKYGSNGVYTKFVGDYYIPYEAIDISDMETIDSILEETTLDYNKLLNMNHPQIIDAPIGVGNWDTTNGYAVYGKSMLVVNGRKICIPMDEISFAITSADFDMRDDQVADNKAQFYPTKFVIGVDSCVIHLPTSYCTYGYSEFIVDQTQHTCTIYDSNSDVTPIFNGAARGTGIYKLKAYCNPKTNAITENTAYSNVYYNDSTNFSWEITRVDGSGSGSANYVTPEDYGAVGDGTTDDSQAVQDACDAGYNVYFGSNKTYYLADTVTIDHDCHLYGGENAVIKTKTPTGGTVNDGIVISGTLKLTTTLTGDYSSTGSSGDNVSNKLTLSSSTGIEIGDILIVTATDQYYSYARQYYYLGATLLVTDIYDGHVFVNTSMPFDIENTANVSVTVYSAPKVNVENLNFVSDHTSGSAGAYIYCMKLEKCKMSEIRNCSFADANNGLQLRNTVGILVDGITIQKVKETNESYDGYGMAVYSCTDTTFRRVIAQAGQSSIDLSGQIPNINTFIKECDLTGECRSAAFGMHENAYNTVLEDCTISGMTGYGTMVINRCTFINNKRISDNSTVALRGSHDPSRARFRIEDTVFSEGLAIDLLPPVSQSPIQSFDSIIGALEIANCKGGKLQFAATTSATILSNKVQRLVIENWKDCYEIYHTAGNTIDCCIVKDSTFGHNAWLNKHSGTFYTDDIKYIERKNAYPQMDRLYVSNDHGDVYYLPENVDITFGSSDTSAHYLVCGENIMPNKAADFNVGTVSGSSGSAMTRTPNSNFSSTISVNSSGELVFTQPNNSTTVCIYPVCLMYVGQQSKIKMSCKLKNTGATTGASFRTYIAIVDAKTGLLTYRNNGDSAQATADGAVITHSRDVPADSYVLAYLYCYTAVANSETTFSEFVAKVMPFDFDSTLTYDPYVGSSRTGDGVLKSVSGMNNIASDATSAVSISFKADLLKREQIPDGSGVSF